ncbi:MAG: alginate lyase family protein [Kiritimatiellae bacterium]|nr:alginate lyase family protein [Kiritimatiellia bacterium]
MTRGKKIIAALIAAMALAQSADAERKFVHPGIFYTQGDIDRMKAMVAAGKEPWKRGFDGLRFGPYSNHGAWARPRGGEIAQGRFNVTIGIDGRRAHDLALMWRLTGDRAYGDKARDFLLMNSNWTSTSWGGTSPLDNGKIYLLVEAAELMRDYDGWKKEDQKRFGDMLRNVFVPHIYSGDVMRWGNQGLTAWHGLLAIAIFLDDDKLYDRVWNNTMGLPHRPDDNPLPAGGVWKPEWPANYGEFFMERTKAPAFGNEPDYGFDDQLKYYIYKNGQCQESCRDQAHTMYGLLQMVALAEIFWNQGDDLYGALDNRILLGLEWSLRYNMSDWVPSGYTDIEDECTFENGKFYKARSRNARWTAFRESYHARGADGGTGSPKTAALMHYAVRAGVKKEKMEWLFKAVQRQLENNGFENWGTAPSWYYEWEGWGTLTKYRTKWQAGDPGTWKNGGRISGAHKIPGVIKAADFDFHPLKKGFTSKYRGESHLDVRKIGKLYGITRLKKGNTADYTLSVEKAGEYRLSVYTVNSGELALTFLADGKKLLSAKIPKSSTPSRHYLGKVELEAGAPVLRLRVDAARSASIIAISVEPIS